MSHTISRRGVGEPHQGGSERVGGTWLVFSAHNQGILSRKQLADTLFS